MGDVFATSVYRKPTFSGVYTNYNSFIPEIYKSGLIRTLLFRLYSICSDWSLVNKEIEHLHSVMKRNGYPDNLINTVTRHFLSRLFAEDNQRKVPTAEKKTFQLCLPFLGKITSKTEIAISKALRQYLPSCKVRITTTATVRLRSLFSFKDKISRYLSSGVVYRFTCGCCKAP